MNMKRRFRVGLCLVAVILLGAFPLASRVMAGQAITTDGNIIGQVTDQSKGVLPGVTVTATSPALQLPSVTTVTDGKGEYRLTPLPIGTYTVEYALSGFQTVRHEGVRLTAGFTAKMDIVLSVGEMAETITVSGAAPQVDVAATNTLTQLTKEILETIPSGRSGYMALLQQTPGVRSLPDTGTGLRDQGPTFNAFGQNGDAWQSIDGVATKNPRNANSGNAFDFMAFEEATVSTLGHDASVPTHGVNVNTVIKSGGNEFHGGGYYAATNSRFQSPGQLGGINILIRDDLQAELGGRIVRDKLWFYASVRKQRWESEVPGCFKPDGALCTPLQPGRYLTFKGTFQPNPSNRFTSFWTGWRSRAVSEPSTIVAWSARRDIYFQPYVTKVEWQFVKGQSLVLTANAGGWDGLSYSVCPDAGPAWKGEPCDYAPSRLDLVTAVKTGLNERTGERLGDGRWQARTSLSYYKPDFFHGNHNFKLGFDAFKVPGNRASVGKGGSGNYQLQYQSGVPARILIYNQPTSPDLAIRYFGTYVADSWTIARKLTLNLGIRHAYDAGYENPTCRVAADYPGATIYPAACFSKVELPVYKTFSPRLRAAYDITGDGRTVVKGGWGRYATMRLADHVFLVANQAIDSTTFRWRDLNGNNNYDPGEVNLDPNGTDFLSRTAGGAAIGLLQGGVVNPNETAPYNDEFSIQFERQLMRDLAVRVTGVQARLENAVRLGNALRPNSAYTIPITNLDPGPDGKVGTADDTGKSITYYDYPKALAGRDFQQAMLVNDPTANEVYTSLELAVTKRLSNHWNFEAAYTTTKRRVPFVANASLFNTQDPNAEVNAADNTWVWVGHISGSYMFPYGILISGNFEQQSGPALARTALFTGGQQIPSITLRVEPIGSINLDMLNLLDFRGEKRFTVRKGQQVQVGVNLYNTLNSHASTAMTVQSGASYGTVTARVAPRILEFQMRYTF